VQAPGKPPPLIYEEGPTFLLMSTNESLVGVWGVLKRATCSFLDIFQPPTVGVACIYDFLDDFCLGVGAVIYNVMLYNVI